MTQHDRVLIGLTVLVAALLCSAARPAEAATWRVEKDGSGDFEILQDALDTCAPGDSILIGAGRFDTFRAATSNVEDFQFAGVAWVTTPNLTLIGAGRDFTFVGPAIATESVEGRPTVGLYVDGLALTRVEGISFEGTKFDVTLQATTILEDCRVTRRVVGSGPALGVAAPGTEIRRTELIGSDMLATLDARGPASQLLLEDCAFENGSDLGTAVEVGHDALECTMRGCTFSGGSVGVRFTGGGTGWVEDCSFEGCSWAGLELQSSWAVVRRCHFGTSLLGILASAGELEVYDTAMKGGTTATLWITGRATIRGSHILNGGGWTLMGGGSSPFDILDLRENWWGTTDLAQIASWCNVNAAPFYWQPILAHAVASENVSIGTLKEQFRSHE